MLGWAITTLARQGAPFTFVDVAHTLVNPADELVALSQRTPLELTHAATPVIFAVDKLLTRTLAGMSNAPSGPPSEKEAKPHDSPLPAKTEAQTYFVLE